MQASLTHATTCICRSECQCAGPWQQHLLHQDSLPWPAKWTGQLTKGVSAYLRSLLSTREVRTAGLGT